MKKQIPVFYCFGWQAAKQAYEHGHTLNIYRTTVPEDVFTGVTDYTHARHMMLDALVESVEEAAGIPAGGLRYAVQED